jgi:hypothetical protein
MTPPLKPHLFSLSLAVALCGTANPAQAQFLSRADAGISGVAVVEAACLASSAPSAAEPNEAFTAALGLVLANLAGDVAAAGMDALGDALEEASSARTFAATAYTSFPFYGIDKEARQLTPLESQPPCLIFAVPGSEIEVLDRPASVLPASYPVLTPAQLEGKGLPSNPALYVEAALERRADGFVVRPLLVWYGERLGTAPNRPLDAELHFTFSTPGALSGDAATSGIFAVARIPLGRLEPGQAPASMAEMAQRSSVVLPLRPETGTPRLTLTALTNAEVAVTANELETRTVARLLPRAQAAAAATNAPATALTALHALEDRRDDAALAAPALRATRDAIQSGISATPAYGSTNVQARFILTRDANAFGLAVAKALQTRAPELGTAVRTALAPDTPESAWTDKDTNYVTAMSTVQQKQAELDTAVLAGAAGPTLTARLALQNSQAAANAAAAASGRGLPFPNIL